MNSAAVNMDLEIYIQDTAFSCFGYVYKFGLLDHIDVLYQFRKDLIHCFPYCLFHFLLIAALHKGAIIFKGRKFSKVSLFSTRRKVNPWRKQ